MLGWEYYEALKLCITMHFHVVECAWEGFLIRERSWTISLTSYHFMVTLCEQDCQTSMYGSVVCNVRIIPQCLKNVMMGCEFSRAYQNVI